ncbi:MAG: YgaP-like transmembrane domain [Candidatus Sumerlaeota bacterium]
MSRENIIRLIAGCFILISLTLALVHSLWWLLFTAFVGINLVQSSITKWCLMDRILKNFGVKSQAERVMEEVCDPADKSCCSAEKGKCC